jgi:hypothetical protein
MKNEKILLQFQGEARPLWDKKKSFGEVNFDEVSQPFWKRFIEVVCAEKQLEIG